MAEKEKAGAEDGGASSGLGGPTPPTVDSIPSENAALATGNKRSEHAHRNTFAFWRELNTNERITAGVAFATFIIGLGSLWVAYLSYQTAKDSSDIKAAIGHMAVLADQTKRQADQTKRQADAAGAEIGELRRQADAANRSADAASNQLAQARRQAEVDLNRNAPHLALSFQTLPPGFGLNGKPGWTTTPTWRNRGSTEATDVYGWSGHGKFPSGTDSNFNFVDDPVHSTNLSPSRFTLVPGDVFSQDSAFYTADDMEDIVTGKIKYIMWGYVEYHDEVSDRWHHIHWCNYILPVAGQRGSSYIVQYGNLRPECNTRD